MKNKQVTPASAPKKAGRPRKNPVVLLPKKVGRPRKNTLTPVNKKAMANLELEVAELKDFCVMWRAKCDKQESEIARIQHLYMDSQAVVRYLESKIEQLFAE